MLHTKFLIFLLLLAHEGHCLTKYINETESIAVKSVRPCHILGDQDLYGVGVRLSFYIQFGIAVVANVFALGEALKPVRRGFIFLIFALLIIIFRSAADGNFVVFEWWLTTCLMSLAVGTLPPITRSRARLDLDLLEGVPQDVGDARRWLEVRYFRFLDDPVGIGFLLILWAVWASAQPWLYWRNFDQGHKSGCLARVRFFGVVNLYNEHFHDFLKAVSIVAVVMAVALVVIGGTLIIIGLVYFRSIEQAAEIVRSASKQLERRRDDLRNQLKRLVQELKPTAVLRNEYQNARLNQSRAYAEGQPTALLQALDARTQRLGEQLNRRLEGQAQVEELGRRIEQQEFALAFRRSANRLQLLVWWALGGLTIWTLESTLDLNDIELGNSIFGSTGQALAFLVAIFSLIAFLWQVVKWGDSVLREQVLLNPWLARVTHMVQFGGTPPQDPLWRRLLRHTQNFLRALAPPRNDGGITGRGGYAYRAEYDGVDGRDPLLGEKMSAI